MKHGVVLQKPDQLLAVLGLVILDFVGLGEEDRSRFLALPHLPLFLLRLLIGHPARVTALECTHIHAEDEDVDAVIAFAGDGIEGRLRASRFFRVPRANPGLHAVLKFGDDAVREFLHRIASRGLGAGLAGCVFRVTRCRHDVPLSFRLTPIGRGERRHGVPAQKSAAVIGFWGDCPAHGRSLASGERGAKIRH